MYFPAFKRSELAGKLCHSALGKIYNTVRHINLFLEFYHFINHTEHVYDCHTLHTREDYLPFTPVPEKPVLHTHVRQVACFK
jgi:hypothetical protein